MRKTFTFFFIALCSFPILNAQTFEWAKQIGGTSEDVAKSIAVDHNGNVYTTGYFYDTCDFDPGVGVFDLLSSPVYGALFVSKVDSAGNFVWAKKVEGPSTCWGYSIAVDANNNVYVTGRVGGTTDFDPGLGTSIVTASLYGDIFILKLDGMGDFDWVKHFAHIGLISDVSAGRDIEIDALGNIYTTGYFVDSVDFDPGSGVYPLVSAGTLDIFVSKLDASGNFLWAKSLGGTGRDEPYALDVDNLGNVYTTGGFNDTVDFDPGVSAFNLVSSGTEIFVSKLNASGNFVFAKHFEGGVGDYYGQGIAVDANQNVYTTGYLNGSVDLDPGIGTIYMGSGIGELFVSKLDLNGDYVWAITTPTSGFAYGNSIATDATGAIYLTGGFMGTGDFDPGAGTQTLTAVGNMDVFILNLDSAGAFSNVWQMGGSSTDRGESIIVDATGSIYTTGTFINAVDFDPSAGTLNFTSYGNKDMFIQKLGDCQMNVQIAVNGNTLSAQPSGVSYQWWDCTLLAPVQGANSQNFTPTVSGNYAVIASQGSCADTSVCTAITVTGTNEVLSVSDIRLYPNPATETLNIESQELIESVTITNLLGDVVQIEVVGRFSVAQLPAGVYLARVQTASGTSNVQFVKL